VILLVILLSKQHTPYCPTLKPQYGEGIPPLRGYFARILMSLLDQPTLGCSPQKSMLSIEKTRYLRTFLSGGLYKTRARAEYYSTRHFFFNENRIPIFSLEEGYYRIWVISYYRIVTQPRFCERGVEEGTIWSSIQTDAYIC
jgi:hypothetical protein